MLTRYFFSFLILFLMLGISGCDLESDGSYGGVSPADADSESLAYRTGGAWCEGIGCSGERLSGDVLRVWNEHIEGETNGKQIQPDCVPRYYQAHSDTEFAGTVVFFHGFTACPQQYFSISEQLAAKGFDVFLPLMPGQGREPFDGPKGEDDNFHDLPGGKDYHRYEDFVDKMNELGSFIEGPKVITGLSGGAALATGAAIEGKGIWDRVLLYAPYYKNPGISGYGSAVLDVFIPSFVNDWGPQCRKIERWTGEEPDCAPSKSTPSGP